MMRIAANVAKLPEWTWYGPSSDVRFWGQSGHWVSCSAMSAFDL